MEALEWGALEGREHGHEEANLYERKMICKWFDYEYKGGFGNCDYVLSEKVADFFISQDRERDCGTVSLPASKPIKKNDHFNLEEVGWLLENSDKREGEYVTVRSIKEKYVMFCCFLAPALCGDAFLVALAAACWELYHSKKDSFRMVAIVRMRPGWESDIGAFHHFLSAFPPNCLAVPFKHEHLRHSLCDRFNLTCFPIGFIVDPSGKILQDNIKLLFAYGGKEAFPFDDNHLDLVLRQDAQWMMLHNGSDNAAPFSLHQILGCVPDTYLRNVIDGKEISVSVLNKKLVWLYFCCNGSLLPKLHVVYKECKNQQPDFEIVLVYFPELVSLEQRFFQSLVNHAMLLRKISGWISPFDNSISRRLRRLSHMCCNDHLFVVGPGGQYLDPYGGEIMFEFGVDGYPFTREGLIQKEYERLKNLTLESLLTYASRDYVVRKTEGGQWIPEPVSKLQGKDIFIYFDWVTDDEELELYDDLLRWYDVIRAKDSQFEVVFVCNDSDVGERFLEHELVSKMPWLVCPLDREHSYKVTEDLSGKGSAQGATIVAFGRCGQIYSIRAQQLVASHGLDDLPFHANLLEEVTASFKDRYVFMRDLSPPGDSNRYSKFKVS